MVERLGCTGPCGDVVEYGCGYGTFTLPAAERVEGTVFAFDIEPVLVEITERKAHDAGLRNVRASVRDLLVEGTGLPHGSVGYVMAFNILHIEEPLAILREARRILTPEGHLGILHWRGDLDTPRGPPLEIRPTREQCRLWAEEAGFRTVDEPDLCCCSWHWGLVMAKAG
jgi:ubiquinone/menaquinone biosynthesis C-methylase UbiE